MAATLKPGGVLAPFAVGNAAPGGRSSVEGVGEEMARRITAMAEAMPPEIRARFQIISGYRDAARQREVNPGVTHSRHGSGTGPPGTGMAVDLGNDPVVLDWIDRNPQHGLGFPLKHMRNEQNHLEMIDQLGGRVPIGGATRMPDFGGGSNAAPVYAETGDPQFKSGLAVPQAPAPEADPVRQAALASLALQAQQNSPFGGGSLGDAFAQVVKAGQPPAQPPSTILGAPQYTNVGGPIPLSRRIG